MLNKWLHKETSLVREKLRPSELPDLDDWPATPMVSVLVAAWNEEDQIPEFLDSFDRIDYPNKELLLIAGGTDSTFERARTADNPPTRLIRQRAGEGKYLSIRRAIGHASGEVVFLTDADCRIDPDHFKRLVFPVAGGTVNAATGPAWPLRRQLKSPFVRAQSVNLFRKMHMVPGISVPFLIGANCAIRGDLLTDCLERKSDQPIGEDYYVAMCLGKHGHRIHYYHAAGIETRFPESFTEYVLQKSRWHRSHLLLHYQFGDRRWIVDALDSIGNQLLLIMPLAPLILGPAGGLIWFLSWSTMFVPYLKSLFLFRSLGRTPRAGFVSLLRLMLADFSAKAICLPQIITRRMRYRW